MIEVPQNLKVHFIGTGGIGMSGIAKVLLSMGFCVSGSDLVESANVEELRQMGGEIFIGHAAENLQDATVVVYSSAVKENNPEILEAKNRKLPIMKRAEMLAELMRLRRGIAVGGTHGKTTTTSLLATILKGSDFDPTYIIGGVVNNLEGHAKVGEGEFLVAEADESDGSFLLLNPIHTILTNIDNDHIDYYGSERKLYEAFKKFANRIPFYGVCALNNHDETIRKLKKVMKKPWVSFGIDDEEMDSQPHIKARDVDYRSDGTSFELSCFDIHFGRVDVPLPGRHNVLNALGAIAISHHLGINAEQIRKGLAEFAGVGRRLQTLVSEKNFEVIDDYGHHPTEIRATLETLKKTRPNQKIVAIFEPHRFSRTRDCWNEFFHCFNSADELYLVPIYPASEGPIEGITSTKLVKDINKQHPQFAHELQSLDEISQVMTKFRHQEGATIAVLGAGNIGKKVRECLT